MVIFSGTIGLLEGELIFGEKFEVELNRPRIPGIDYRRRMRSLLLNFVESL